MLIGNYEDRLDKVEKDLARSMARIDDLKDICATMTEALDVINSNVRNIREFLEEEGSGQA